jgi:hypothetical protein
MVSKATTSHHVADLEEVPNAHISVAVDSEHPCQLATRLRNFLFEVRLNFI